MKYVLLFAESEEYAKELDAMSREERDRAFMLVAMWFAEHGDKIRGHGKLQEPHTATTVRRGDDGDLVVTDGPFVEGKEIVSGYAEIEAEDLDEALRIVAKWPGCPTVEIRPLLA